MKQKLRSIIAWALVCAMLLGDNSFVLATETTNEGVQTEQAAAPETAAPETAAPETAAPETAAPETVAPETAAPETSAPETAAPDTEVPESATPETAAPASTEPETAAPETPAQTEFQTEAQPQTEKATELQTETETEPETETETETEKVKTNFTYSDAYVTVTAVASEAAKLPANSELRADYLAPGTGAYESAMNQAQAALGYNGDEYVMAGAAVDVYFLADNQRIEPEAGTVQVTVRFNSPVSGIDEETAGVVETAVVHIGSNGTEEIAGNVSANSEGEVSGMTFSSDTFSPFVAGVVMRAAAVNPTSTNLKDFLTSATITGAEQEADGSYTVKAGKEYTVSLNFAEVDRTGGLQFDNAGPLTYALPAGFEAADIPGEITIVSSDASGNTFEITGNPYTISNGQITFNWNTSDPNFGVLAGSSNAKFNLNVSGSFSEDADQINWSDRVVTDVNIDNSNQVTVTKSGYYDSSAHKFHYYVTARSNGRSTNVVLTDTMTGTALTYDNNAKITGNSTTPTGGSDGNGFTYTFPSMEDGESVTIEYTASVNPTALSGSGTMTVDETSNKVTTTSDGQEKPDEATKDFAGTTYMSLSKAAGEVADGEDGDKIIPWTVTYNADCTMAVGGGSITDTIDAESAKLMTYAGNGLTIQVYDADGTLVETRTPSWSQLANKSDSTWTYSIPSSDTAPYKYVITYNTTVDGDSLLEDVNVKNQATDDHGHGSWGGTNVGPGEDGKAGVSKVATEVTTDYVVWTVKLAVPANGLKTAVVTDTFPADGDFQDILYPGSTVTVDGTVAGESYDINTSDAKKMVITFNKDGQSGLKGTGAKRTITVTVKTKMDPAWVENAKTDTWREAHTNNVTFDANGKPFTASASAVPKDQSIKKTAAPMGNAEDGLPYYKYELVLTGVDAESFDIPDTFPTEYLAYYDHEAWSGEGHVFGGDQYYQGTTAGTLTAEGNATGATLHVTLSGDPDNYGYYRILYYLKVKDQAALTALQQAAGNAGGTATVTNSATFGNTASADITYKYTPLTKELVNEYQIGGTNNVAQYKIDINPGAATMNGGQPMTLTDTYENLSIDFATIQVTPSAGVEYSFSGNTGTFIVPDATHVTITYSAKIKGTGKVTISNVASMKGETAGSSKEVDVKSSGSGESSMNSIRVMKYKEGHMEVPLNGAEFTLYDGTTNQELGKFTTGADGVAVISGANLLHPGEPYYLVETKAPEGYAKSPIHWQFTISENDQADYSNYIYFNNDIMSIADKPETSLTINKTIAGDLAEVDLTEAQKKAITFTITGKNFSETVTYDKFTNGSYKLTGLEPGAYTVTETGADFDSNYTLKTVFDGTEGSSEEVTTTVDDTDKTVNVTNTYDKLEGSLTFTKSFAGDELAENQIPAITFTVTGPNDYEETFDLADIKQADGSYSKTIEHLALGEYTVAESDAEVEGYSLVTSYKVGSEETSKATVEDGKEATIDVTNTYTLLKGGLTITKSFTGDTADLTKEQKEAITFTITGENNYTKTVTYADFTNGSLTVEDLVPGNYTVTETNAAIDGYEVTTKYDGTVAENQIVKVTKDGASVGVTNDYNKLEGSLTFTKSFAGDVLAEGQIPAITFTVTGPNDYEETFDLADIKQADGSYSKTIENLPLGEYTVAESGEEVEGYSVETKYVVGSSETSKATVTDGGNATVTVTNTYTQLLGALKITKTFAGDDDKLTDDQKKAVAFKITGENYEKDVTYADFEADGTLTIPNLVPGNYTVTESNTAVDGFDVETKYDGTVAENKTVTVAAEATAATAITNTYNKLEGSLTFTKSFAEDELAEDQIPAITFMVTGPNDYSETFDLADIKQADGSYSKTIEHLALGEYTVAESDAEVEGYSLVTSYKVGSEETSKATVEDGKEATVNVTNTYTLLKGGLTITKSFTGDTADLTKEQKEAISFTITGANNYSKTVTFAEFTNGSFTVENLVPGNYTVTETNAAIDGYEVSTKYDGTVAANKVVALTKDGAAVAVTNDYNKLEGSLTFTKSFAGDELAEDQIPAITFTVTGPNDYEETFDLADIKQADGSYSKTIENLPLGEYTVAEEGADVDGYSVETKYVVGSTETSKATVTDDGNVTVAVTNTYTQLLGALKITKTFAGDADKLTDDQKKAVAFKITGENFEKDVTFADFEADGTYTITDLVPGDYTVTESNTAVDGFEVETKYDGTVAENKTVTVAAEATAATAITNTYNKLEGSLTFTKSFAGDELAEDQIPAITFTVTGPNDYSETFDLADIKQTDGSYSKTIEHLALGEYTVAESDADVEGYSLVTSYKVGSDETSKATVEDGKEATIEVTNTYTLLKGGLTITKSFTGDTAELTKEQKEAITFTITGENNFTKTVTYADFTDGSYTEADLVPGNYTVTETNAAIDGYEVTTKYDGTVAENKIVALTKDGAAVAVTNNYNKLEGSLTFTKSFAGDELAEDQIPAITFTVTGPNDYSETFDLADIKQADGSYSKTIENLPLGEYTVAEEGAEVEDYSVETKYTVGSEAKATAEVSDGGEATIDVTNTYTQLLGALKITKTFAGDDDKLTDDQKKAVAFKITGENFEKDVTFADLEADGTYTITDLVPGDYTVTESNTAVDGFEVETKYDGTVAENKTVTVAAEATADTAITNTYNKLEGSLTFTKSFAGDELAEDQNPAISFTVTGPNDYEETFDLADIKQEDGSYSKTIENLPLGDYTVAEEGADVDGYSLVTSYKVGSEATSKATVEDGKEATINVTNTYTLLKGGLTITKSFTGDTAELTKEQKEAITFTITGENNFTKTVTYADFTDGSYTEEDLVPGSYTVTETNAAIDGYEVTTKYDGTVAENKVVALTKDGAAVAVTNDYNKLEGSLTFTKSFAGDELAEDQIPAITFTVTGPNDYEETFDLADIKQADGSYSKTIENLPLGEYTVDEEGAEVDGYRVVTKFEVGTTETSTATVEDGKEATIDVTNTYTQLLGALKITKTFAGDDDKLTDDQKKAVAFKITGENYEKDVTYADFEADGTLTIPNLVPGNYTVTESNTAVDGFDVETKYDGTVAENKTVTVAAEATAETAITNTYNKLEGSLTFTKSFAGDELAEDQIPAITFTVTGPNDYEETFDLADIKQEDGSYSKTIENLPLGDYTVAEEGADVDGYSVVTKYEVGATETSTAKVEDGKVATIDVTNTYTLLKGGLTITKSFTGDTAELTKEQKEAITFTITGENNFTKTVTYADFTDGSYTEEDLVPGSYTVTETNAAIDGYEVSTKYDGTVAANKVVALTKDGAAVAVTNDYNKLEGSLTFTKSFAGDELAEDQIPAISFTVTGPNDYEETFDLADIKQADGSYSKTIENLPLGEYTVAESGEEVEGYSVETKYVVGSSETSKATVTDGGNATVAVTNTYTQLLGALKITKTFAGDADKLTEDQKKAVAFKITGENFEKDVTFADFKADGTYTITDLVPGDYTVTESNTAVEGFEVETKYDGTVAKNKTVTVAAEATAETAITNTYNKLEGSLTFTKSFAGDELAENQIPAITFTVTGPNDYEETFDLADIKQADGSYSKTIENLSLGDYTVAEEGAEVDGYSVVTKYEVGATETSTAKVEDGKEATIDVTNTYTLLKGGLTITKSFTGDTAELTKEQKEAITFTVTGDNNYSKTVTFAEFTDGSLTVEDLVPGNYTVTETNAAIDGYKVTTKYDGIVAENQVVKVTKDGAAVAVTNDYNKLEGSLTFTKSFAGDELAEDQIPAITFTVTGPKEYSETFKLADIKQADGSYSKTIENLPLGEYTVAEEGAEVDGYSVETKFTVGSKETATAEVTDGEEATINVTNTYTQLLGALKITKTFNGDEDKLTADQKKAVAFTIEGENNYSKIVTFADFAEDGTYTIEDLVPGTYTVTETNTAIDGFEVTTKYDGEATAHATAAVVYEQTAETVITNTYNKLEGSLTFTKDFAGDKLAEDQIPAITFNVTGPEEYNETFKLADIKQEDGSYRKTIEHLPLGDYTVTENDADVDGYSVATRYMFGETEIATATVTDGEEATIKVTNTYTQLLGALKIMKTFSGDADKLTADQKKAVTFTIAGTDYEKTVSYADFAEDGTYTIENLVPGEYTVTESNAAVDGFKVTTTYDGEAKEHATVTVVYDKTAETAITNTYNKLEGSLVLTKTFKGEKIADKDKEKITFIVTGPDGFGLKTLTLADFTKSTDGTYTYSFENVPLGSYTVTEKNAKVDGFVLETTYSVAHGTVTVEDGVTEEIGVTNTYSVDETETESETETETETKPNKPNKPGKPGTPGTPKTGDNTPILPYAGMLLAAALVILLIVSKRSKFYGND